MKVSFGSNTAITLIKDELIEVQEGLIRVIPELSPEATIFRPTWNICYGNTIKTRRSVEHWTRTLTALG